MDRTVSCQVTDAMYLTRLMLSHPTQYTTPSLT